MVTSFKKIGLALELEEKDPAVLIDIILNKIRLRKHLIVFDNAEDETPILNRLNECESHVIVTHPLLSA